MSNFCAQPVIPIQQLPAEFLDYTIDWPKRGLPVESTIIESTFQADSMDYIISNNQIVSDGLQVLFWLTGGISGTNYVITNTITLSTGEIMQVMIPYLCLFQRIL